MLQLCCSEIFGSCASCSGGAWQKSCRNFKRDGCKRAWQDQFMGVLRGYWKDGDCWSDTGWGTLPVSIRCVQNCDDWRIRMKTKMTYSRQHKPPYARTHTRLSTHKVWYTLEQKERQSHRNRTKIIPQLLTSHNARSNLVYALDRKLRLQL